MQTEDNTNNETRLTVDSSGNFSIGATTTQQKFEVHGGGIRINGNITTPSSGVSGTLIDYFQSDARFWSRGADASTVGGFKFIGLENDGGNQSTQLEIDKKSVAFELILSMLAFLEFRITDICIDVSYRAYQAYSDFLASAKIRA